MRSPPGRIARGTGPDARRGNACAFMSRKEPCMQEKRVFFPAKRHPLLPAMFVVPQMLVIGLFFLYPAGQAISGSLFMEDPFGLYSEFVGLENFIQLLKDPMYRQSIWVSLLFSACVVTLSMSAALLLAVLTDRVRTGKRLYTSILTMPYAVAPAVAGVLWAFLFNPGSGVVAHALGVLGYDWNHQLNGNQAMLLVVIAASWKQIAYNFLFFLAGLHAIPKSLLEAAAIDGASFGKRFATIVWPLLSPTTFYLLVINSIHSLFSNFGIIHSITRGGPGTSTNILVYKVYLDGFVGRDYGSSSAQSVILMLLVTLLTYIQFKYVEKKVQY